MDKSSLPSHGMRADAGWSSARPASRLYRSDPKKDAMWYMFIAVVLLELAVAVVAMLCGIMRAEPAVPGGTPVVQFPWLGWIVGAVVAPVALFLLLQLSSLVLSKALDGPVEAAPDAPDANLVPQRVRRFYACVRHAPVVVLLVCLLLLGAAMIFLGDFWEAVRLAGGALTPYVPWFVGGAAAFLAVGYLGRLFFVFRHRQMEQEYAFRREVLEKTGIVLVSKNSVPLAPSGQGLEALPGGGYQLTDSPALPPAAAPENQENPDTPAAAPADSEDVVDVDDKELRPAPPVK